MIYLQSEATRCAAIVGISTIALYLMWRELSAANGEVADCRQLIARERELRQVERKGRISIQKQKRHDAKVDSIEKGFNFFPIGHIESPFPDRRGTPRQPNLVRAATGRIKFNKKIIQHEHFKELQEFSHIWIIWVFHVRRSPTMPCIYNLRFMVTVQENTNTGSADIPAKIKPPRLHGAKVGCMSTRSPHRPNPIGLSVSEVRQLAWVFTLYA